MRQSIFLVLILLVFSCGGYNSGVRQPSEKGFLKFVGNTFDVEVSIDDGPQFLISYEVDQYEIKPGKHTVKVYRDNQLVVNRVVIVENQTIFEIEVP